MRVTFNFIKVCYLFLLSFPVIFAIENDLDAKDELVFVHIVSKLHFQQFIR